MVGIVILNYNNAQDTMECIESILQLNCNDWICYIVDNHSDLEIYAKISAYIESLKNNRVLLIRNSDNLGYAGGNNIGIMHAISDGADYVWILNNDTTVDNMSLSYMLNKMYTDSDIGLCGSKLIYSWNRDKIQGYGGKYNKYFGTSTYITDINQINDMDYVIGASVLVSRKFLQDIGLMSEDYFLYYEELDWAERAKGRYKIGCAVNSIVYHKEGGTINNNSRKEKSYISDYYSLKNRLLFTKKFYNRYLPLVMIGLLIAIVNRIKRGQYNRVLMIAYIVKLFIFK